jgi:protein-tyrosine phosphatase
MVMTKIVQLLVGFVAFASSSVAMADLIFHPPIPKFFEVSPESRCSEGMGAPARSTGTIFRGGRPSGPGFEILTGLYSVKSVDNLEDGSAPKDEMNLIKSLGLSIEELLHPLPGFGVISLGNGQYDHDAMIAAVSELRRSSNFPIFVHCTHGEDRTGMVVALHRVFNECWSAKKATAEWDEIQEPFGNEIQDKMHDYFEAVTGSAELSDYYRAQLAKVQ